MSPIKALAVNAETGMPSDNNDGAPGCHLLTWPAEVDAAIAYRLFRETI